MKNYLKLICLTACIAISGWYMKGKINSSPTAWIALPLDNVVSLTNAESSGCYSGGYGASSCSINAGTDIVGFGVSAGCSVSCISGYYACCNINCACIKR